MSLVLSFLFIVPVFLMGFFLVKWLIPGTLTNRLVISIPLGMAAGLGLDGCTYYFWSLLFSPSQKGFLFVELALSVLFAFLLFRRSNEKDSLIGDSIQDRRENPRMLVLILGAVLLATLAAAVVNFTRLSLTDPHGRYDAWAIWNLRARFIYRGGEFWQESFKASLFHPDYPLMVPLNVARGWLFEGGETQYVNMVVAGAYTFGTLGLLGAALAYLRSSSQGLLAAILLASASWMIYFGTLQFADIPMSLFVLAATFCLFISVSKPPPNSGLLSLGGLFAGFAGWTKNEGMVFTLAFSVGVLFFLLLKRSRKFSFSLGLRYSLGLVLPISAILTFKLFLAPQNDIVNSQSFPGALSLFFSPDRYSQVFGALSAFPKGLGGWPFPIVAFLIVYGLLLWFKIKPSERVAVALCLSILAMQWIGYFGIYMITPYNLQKQINQSLDRLIMQLLPAMLFIYFLIVRPPEEAFIKTSTKPLNQAGNSRILPNAPDN